MQKTRLRKDKDFSKNIYTHGQGTLPSNFVLYLRVGKLTRRFWKFSQSPPMSSFQIIDPNDGNNLVKENE